MGIVCDWNSELSGKGRDFSAQRVIQATEHFDLDYRLALSPIGWAFVDLDIVLHEAAKSAEVTHNHPEGIKGAQAVAAAIFVARTGQTKDHIAALLSDRFDGVAHGILKRA